MLLKNVSNPITNKIFEYLLTILSASGSKYAMPTVMMKKANIGLETPEIAAAVEPSRTFPGTSLKVPRNILWKADVLFLIPCFGCFEVSSSFFSCSCAEKGCSLYVPLSCSFSC